MSTKTNEPTIAEVWNRLEIGLAEAEKQTQAFFAQVYKIETLDEVCEKYGIKNDPLDRDAPWFEYEFEPIELDDDGEIVGGTRGAIRADFARTEINAQFDDDGRDFVKRCTRAQVEKTSVQLRKQTRIGRPGTKIRSGSIEIEQNAKLKPFVMRGRKTNPGMEQHIYRSEPVAFKHSNEIKSLATSATYNPKIPRTLDEETRALTLAIDRDLKKIRSGFDKLLEESAAGLAIHAWFIAEKIYDLENGRTVPFTEFVENDIGEEVKKTVDVPMDVRIVDVEHRAHETVENWLLDDRATRLAAVELDYSGNTEFDVLRGGENARERNAAKTAIIPAGETPRTARLVHCAIHGTGLNFEGTSANRVIAGLRKLKETLLNATGVGYQKFAVPIPKVKTVPKQKSAFDLASTNDKEDERKLSTLMRELDSMRSKLGYSLRIPEGFDVEFETPTGQMPDVIGLLEYIDLMISMAYSNEGALLGHSTFGSFNLATEATNRFLRSADAYVSKVAGMLTKILHDLIRWNHPDPDMIQEWPVYEYSFIGANDDVKWIGVVLELMAADPPVSSWPDELRENVATRLGVSRDVFDSVVAMLGSEQTPSQPTEGPRNDGSDLP